jgi:hypothetical protein
MTIILRFQGFRVLHESASLATDVTEKLKYNSVKAEEVEQKRVPSFVD